MHALHYNERRCCNKRRRCTCRSATFCQLCLERLRRSKRGFAGVPRAQSMSSVYDISQRTKAKPTGRKQTEGEVQVDRWTRLLVNETVFHSS